jgi:hypothetical protein
MSGKYLSLYQINTRVWLTELSRNLGRPATLDDVPDADLDHWRDRGFNWIWFLSVWLTGEKSRHVSRTEPGWRKEFSETLTDLKEEDIGGSGFAIAGYTVHPDLGGETALARLRDRLKKRGLKLMLDFVPNHMGLDHPWIDDHPDYFISGTEWDLKSAPQNYTRIKTRRGEEIFAYGRDPYFAGWPDTLQLNYANPATHEAMIGELVNISRLCDGVRCDMAMLILPEIFERTWGRRHSPPFWTKATKTVCAQHPNFCFMAEVYWNMEWTLQQQGFDYAYDKRLYDRLREGHARPVREHFLAEIGYQDKLARFLENHDECRAAVAFDVPQHKAAAVITFLSPGLRFFHQGQFEGSKKRISPHLIRGPVECVDSALCAFYDKLLAVLRRPETRDGRWALLNCHAAGDANSSWNNFVAFSWEGPRDQRILVAVNQSPTQSQCFVPLNFNAFGGHPIRLQDLMSPACYERTGDDLLTRGLFLDLPPWGFHVFEVLISQKKEVTP